MNMKTKVWSGHDYLGCIEITAADWANCREGRENWREAALNAAHRVFGAGAFYVDEFGPVTG